VNDRFAPQLAMMLDPNQVQLQPGSATGPGATSALSQTASGSGTVAVANRLSLLKFNPSISLARSVSLIGGALAALLLVAGLLLGRRARPADEEAQIARLYRDLIVQVEALPTEFAGNVVKVSSIEGLARIADQAGKMIMHVELGGLHTYFVEDGGVRYAYEHGIGADLSQKVQGGDSDTAAFRLAQGA
jgi:hypothetical protein